MARYPREEISYKKLYKSVDLDKPLNIEWAETPECNTTIVDETADQSDIDIHSWIPDQLDINFCNIHSIDINIFYKIYHNLECVYDKLLKSRLKQLKPIEPSGYCDICGRIDILNNSDEEDQLIACNGCGITVHMECYGVSHSFGLFWFCSRCLFSDWSSPCLLCNNPNGIFKITDDNRWIHAVCACIHPDLSFSNLNYKDPVDLSDLISVCGICDICDQHSSFLINCSYDGCESKYHTGCAAEQLMCDLNNRRTYCTAHDTTTDRECTISEQFEINGGYEELENGIFIRKKEKIKEKSSTEYKKIINNEINNEIDKKVYEYNKIDNEIDKKVYEYWIDKHKVYKNLITDPFRYINYINE